MKEQRAILCARTDDGPRTGNFFRTQEGIALSKRERFRTKLISASSFGSDEVGKVLEKHSRHYA